MKKNNLFLIGCLWATSMFFMAGCGKTGSDKSVSDPEGTIMVSMANSGGGYISGQQYFAYGTDIYLKPSSADFMMIESNNFFVWGGYIATVGKVNGLGNIVKVPSSGFFEQSAVEPGYGYVITINDGTYARLYVVEWILNTGNGIIGAKVKYQYPWQP